MEEEDLTDWDTLFTKHSFGDFDQEIKVRHNHVIEKYLGISRTYDMYTLDISKNDRDYKKMRISKSQS